MIKLLHANDARVQAQEAEMHAVALEAKAFKEEIEKEIRIAISCGEYSVKIEVPEALDGQPHLTSIIGSLEALGYATTIKSYSMGQVLTIEW